MTKLNASALEFEPLVQTGMSAGTVRYGDMLEMTPFGPRGLNPRRLHEPGLGAYVLAARIKGHLKANQPMAEEGQPAEKAPPAEKPAGPPATPAAEKSAEAAAPSAMEVAPLPPTSTEPEKAPAEQPAAAAPAEGAEKPAEQAAPPAAAATEAKPTADATEVKPAAEPAKEAPADLPPPPAEKKEPPKDSDINVILVADIDMLHREFFMLREQGNNPEAGLDLNFDNVTFVLNILDELAGDNRFIEIRKHRPTHRTLKRVDEQIEEARKETTKSREELQKEFAKARGEERRALDKKMDELKADMRKRNLDEQEILRRVALALTDGQRRMDIKVEQLQQKQDREIKRIETKQALHVRQIQDMYKFWAVALPPIPPLLVAIGVFFTRRAREREGVARTRLRG
jgi:hypothetical protein